MSDDLIKRLDAGIARCDMLADTVPAAFAEAQAEIARLHDQIGDWIVRADEANTRADRMEKALRRIADWELPPSGRFYPNADGSDSDRPAPYDSVFGWGSEGGKRAVREIARAALSPVATDQGEG